MKINTPKFWFENTSIIQIILSPLSLIWLLASWLIKKIKREERFSVPIICVGNLIAGGGGKTPLTLKLASLFLKKGYKTHIIKKQYKSKNKNQVVLVNKNSDPSIVGDEAILAAYTTTTWLVKNRIKGIRQAIKLGAELIILDDGYQDFSVSKDYNILVVKDKQHFGNKSIIPAGPLRENIKSGLQRTDHIFYYGTKDTIIPVLLKINKPITYVDIKYPKTQSLKKIKNKNVLAFAGIAHPENFFDSITYYGFCLRKKISYPDHYDYSERDIEKIIDLSLDLNLSVITTEKDFIKIPKKLRPNIFYIPFDIQFNSANFYKSFISKVSKID